MTFEVTSALSIYVNKFLDVTSRSLSDDNESSGRLATSKCTVVEEVIHRFVNCFKHTT